MTAEEAIKTLMNHRRNAERFIEGMNKRTLSQMPTIANLVEACDVAIEALEKQIPKKPVKKNPICYSKTIQGEEHYAYDFHCVQCGEKINGEGHHCPCGQAIDWSEE